jgi:hypothetical protein
MLIKGKLGSGLLSLKELVIHGLLKTPHKTFMLVILS